MVQYILTPWRTRRELLLVRRNFYGPSPYRTAPDESPDRRQQAVDQVGMWIQRGNCPHMVESTLLLTAAVLSDEAAQDGFTVRSAYAMAFSRFVTGLLDGQQDKKQKQSMYSLAKTVGLPATFVELRHESTHEALPSRKKLRDGATRALRWIWENYWCLLGEVVLTEEASSVPDGRERVDADADQDQQTRSSTGWTLYEEAWKPKPIGAV